LRLRLEGSYLRLVVYHLTLCSRVIKKKKHQIVVDGQVDEVPALSDLRGQLPIGRFPDLVPGEVERLQVRQLADCRWCRSGVRSLCFL